MTSGFADLAKRTEEIKPFLAVEVFERAEELQRRGHDVVHRVREGLRRVGEFLSQRV